MLPGLVVVVGGCPNPATVAVDISRSEPFVPAFALDRNGPVGNLVPRLSVHPCASVDSANPPSLWTATAEAEAPPPTVVLYGEAPDGFRGSEALPLSAGCYYVSIGSSQAYFEVAADGSISRLSSDEGIARGRGS